MDLNNVMCTLHQNIEYSFHEFEVEIYKVGIWVEVNC